MKGLASLDHQKIHAFQTKILDRYAENKREGLPWRDSFDPYHVFVSEVMSQQTQVDRVVPKFNAFIAEAPSFEVLAALDKKDLLRLRSGLGFNSRAMRLQQAAQILCEEYDWKLPQDRELLQSLPGIGQYCSASILAFVFNETAPVVDTNIRRVFIYELGLDIWIKQKDLEAVAVTVTPDGRANDRNNALMDYGALEATAKKTWIKPLSKQSKFAWSKRQVRWNVLKRIIKNGPTNLSVLKKEFSHESFDEIITWMIADWLIAESDGVISI